VLHTTEACVRRLGYVLAVARSHRAVTCPAVGPQRVDQLVAALAAWAWNRHSAGPGAKGPRDYDWAWLAISPPADETAGCHWLLVRRSLTDGELAFYRCWSPTPVALSTLVRVAGTRWCIETCFQTAKGAVDRIVRSWKGAGPLAARSAPSPRLPAGRRGLLAYSGFTYEPR
jgi:SRSO17 transposase